MDYVEGESLDKPLRRGERFAQAQVVEWACQLLEALCYLHSRPPHGILHGDIKPANVMLTPENDIRLIDFNIVLALGEEGADSAVDMPLRNITGWTTRRGMQPKG